MPYRFFIYILYLSLSSNTFAQEKNDSFNIVGVIKGLGNSKVLLGNKPPGYPQTFKIKYYDSCVSHNDTFDFKGHVSEPSFYSIESIERNNGWKYFIIENSTITITGNMDSIYRSKIEGSVEHATFMDYRINHYIPLVLKQNKFFDLLDSIRKYQDTVQEKINRDSINHYAKLIEFDGLHYIKNHPGSFTALYILNDLVHRNTPIDTVKLYFSYLTDKLKNHSIAKDLHFFLFQKPDFDKPGTALSEFLLPDTSGKSVSNRDYSGKYLILAFWASWCGPCIAELPDLKRIYAKYDHQNLEILGISLDVDSINWKKSVLQHGIPWKTVCDLEGNSSTVSKLFNINSIPRLYLVSPEGRIVLANANLKELEVELDKKL